MVFRPRTTLFADGTRLPAALMRDQCLPAPGHFQPGTQTLSKIQLLKIEKKGLVQPLKVRRAINWLQA